MKSTLIAILLILFAKQAEGQSTQTIPPFQSAQDTVSQPVRPSLNLGNLNKLLGPAPAPTNGVLFYFDYTQFLQWLIPKKHPKIPPECDPKYLMNDSIPPDPVIKKDTVRATKPPV
jgi:hypothetical protein